jgi:hypothetical protein
MNVIEQLSFLEVVFVVKHNASRGAWVPVETNKIINNLRTHSWDDLTSSYSECEICKARISITSNGGSVYLKENMYRCFTEDEIVVKDVIE